MTQEHMKLLEEREKKKSDALKQKIMNDKQSRDVQLLEERRRRRMEEKNEMQ